MPEHIPIKITRVEKSRVADYDFDNITFGNNPTDHMFLSEYKNGEWQKPRIEPLANFSLSPMALCFHYGQTVFEGMRSYRLADGNINLFRLDKHFIRMNKSLERMCMPMIPEGLFYSSIENFVLTEKQWIPYKPNTTLYLRPFVIATEPRIGVKISDQYTFAILGLPLSNYYSSNLKVKVETEFIRAASGGTGYAKCGGNYGGAFYPTYLAKKQGFDQVLWTDAANHEFIEESGTMNVMFVIDGVLITPPLSGSILDGITRDSLLQIAQSLGIKTEVRKISYREIEEVFKNGKKVEAFGVGTAAVVSPIESIDIHGNTYKPVISDKAVYKTLKDKINAIRTGAEKDIYGWNHIVEVK